MLGEILAGLAGVGFGVFQSINRRAAFGIDVQRATFTVLLVSAIFLGFVSVLSEDLDLLWNAPFSSWLLFIIAGLIHFFLGWTLLNISQRSIGAARTGALVGTAPLFATVIAAIMLGEWLKPLAVIGIVVVVIGVYFTTPKENNNRTVPHPPNPGSSTPTGIRSGFYGLATALCWAISPVFVRQALKDLPSPLLGVEIGMIACALSYGILLFVQREKRGDRPAPSREALILLTFGGIISAAAIWGRWAAIDLTSVAIVTTLSLFSVVVVMLLSPIIIGRKYENITPQAILGAVMIVGGSVILVLFQ